MSKVRGHASAEIVAPIEQVWTLLADADRAPEWQRGLLGIEVLERDEHGRAVRCMFETDAKIRTLRSVARIRYDAPHRLGWHQVSGDLKAAAGHWQLEDLGGLRTRVTYVIEAEIGGILAAALRGPLVGLLQEKLAGARPGELKRAVEAGALTAARGEAP